MGTRGVCVVLGVLVIAVLCNASEAGRQLASAQGMAPGYGLSPAGTTLPCPVGLFNPGGSSLRCQACGGGWTTVGKGKKSFLECVIMPGWEWDAARSMPRPCDAGTWSAGGSAKQRLAKCQRCPDGSTTETDRSTAATDCHICVAGHGGEGCPTCPPNTWSSGGLPESFACNPCDPEGYVSARGSENVVQCYSATLEPTFDRFWLSKETLWKTVSGGDSVQGCAAACTSSSTPCVMSRWNDELQQCQLLYESDEGSLLAFKVAGGMDYVIFTVAQGLTAGDDVASFKDMTMQQCMAACTADNNCEAVAHPGLKARGACGLFNSVLDAGWVSRVNVMGDHLSTGRNW